MTVFYLSLHVCVVTAQDANDLFPWKEATSNDLAQPIELSGDVVEYNRGSGQANAWGNVVIQWGDDELRADMINFNTVTEDVYASGNVTVKRMGGTWHGTEARYNIRTGAGSVPGMFATAGPFIIDASQSEKIDGKYVFKDATVTTCAMPPGHKHYCLKARKATMLPRHYLLLQGAVLQIGSVP
ncbi:MAG: LPS-assembly protein LptD, partial [Lentisphaerae bacterium]|nr:LPS-assembly protein LptD [Lentisphaerota bacterium]